LGFQPLDELRLKDFVDQVAFLDENGFDCTILVTVSAIRNALFLMSVSHIKLCEVDDEETMTALARISICHRQHGNR
jgi:hypothetical protein